MEKDIMRMMTKVIILIGFAVLPFCSFGQIDSDPNEPSKSRSALEELEALLEELEQEIVELNTYCEGGVTYTGCYDASRDKPHSGAKVNGRLVVPCKYDFIYGRGGHLFAYPDYDYNGPADVYTPDGQLLFPVSKGICRVIEGINNSDEVFFQGGDFSIYNSKGKFLLNPKVSVNQYDFCHFKGSTLTVLQTKDGSIYNMEDGRYVTNSDDKGWLLYIYSSDVGEKGDVYLSTKKGERYGLVELKSGQVIFEPEFEACGYLGHDFFKFKMNGVYGVMNKAGKVIIPTSRQYTKIEYNKTFKKFIFEKEGGYRGECNANGVQTSISKASTQKTATSSSNNIHQTSNKSSISNKSNTSTKPSEPGLLYKGEYTISNPLSFPLIETISIYEDRIESTGISCNGEYKSTNSKGERNYIGEGTFGVTNIIYVDANFNIRLIQRYPNQYTGGSNDVVCTVTKGTSQAPVQNNTGNYGNGGYTPPPSSNSGSGTTTNPVQPHQRTKICTSCGHSGKCPNCNGKGWRTVNGTSVRCTNCNGTGRCPYCGGTGEKKVTEYY